MKDIVHETLLYHYNQAVDDLVCAKENHDYYWGAWLDCDADTPDNQYNHTEKMVAYWHREMVRRTQEYRSFKAELEWLEFHDSQTYHAFSDYRGVSTIAIHNLTSSLHIALRRQAYFAKTNALYVASTYAKKAADLEWMLFQEVN